MKNIKSMIKKMSDEQEIHDVSNNVLKNVDMNKVERQVFVKESSPKRFILLTNLFSAFAAALIVVIIALSINTPSSERENNSGDTTTNDVTDNDTLGFEDNYLMFSQYLQTMQKQEAYNIINIAPSIDKFVFSDVTFGDSKEMTESEMEALVDDLNTQIYNVEEMLGITSIDCISTNNQYYGIHGNPYSDYENVISVTGPLSSYHLYFTETSVTEKNVGETNFKSKSNITGVLDTNNVIVNFIGQKEYKNGETTYTTLIELSTIKIEVEEVFGKDSNEFTYTFYKGEKEKAICIKQKLDDNRNVIGIEEKPKQPAKGDAGHSARPAFPFAMLRDTK